MYARKIGISHAETGPIASSRSERHGAENEIENASHPTVHTAATVKRRAGRGPNVGRARR